ncbi:ALAT1 aminotransferase, partial [Burhinus bistriatus]|nr:ALAT1 aminotransferase [Burhinus bistriatus]
GVPKPFTEVIKANIGDAHAMGQKPITFLRQVTALCLYPELLTEPSIPEDAKDRARRLLAACSGQSAGAYSASPGIELVRQDVARFLQRRDGIPAKPQDIFLSTGASDAIVVRGHQPSPMSPGPRAVCHPPAVPTAGTHKGTFVPGLAPAPGWAVYQDNIYAEGSAFHSFKKVLFEMGPPYSEVVELASFHSVSKGFMGECGFRSGYMEVVNMDPEVQQQLAKLVSVRLCPPVPGQILLDAVIDPPKPGDPSYELFITYGMSWGHGAPWRCTETLGMGLPGDTGHPGDRVPPWRRVTIPSLLPQVLGLEPDVFFCQKLLEATGIVLAPGSEFGQSEGTHH